MNPIIYQNVYYVESNSSTPLNPIAIRPSILENEKSIFWEDTSRGTTRHYTQINPVPSSDIPDSIQVITPKEILTFTKLTLDLYNQKVRYRVTGQPEFNSDEELKNYYLQTEFQLY